MPEFSRQGLAIGKFWPPHNGHLRLIDRLRTECEKSFVVICASRNQVPSGEHRAMWIQAMVPEAEVIVVDDFCAPHYPDPCPLECSARWARRIEHLGIGPVSVVVTAAEYGSTFAAELGARHVEVDRTLDGGLSSTLVREDLHRHWHDIPRVVRQGLFRKVVVVGAESTGTTTLTMALSGFLGGPVVAEAGRTMSWVLFAENNAMDSIKWTENHFWRIIDAQVGFEHRALSEYADSIPSRFGPWLVCDTDLLATVAWWERYLSSPAEALHQLARIRSADLYVVTSPSGVEFDDSDPLRDGRDVRLRMHQRFLELVEGSGRPWIEVSGPPETRLQKVIETLADYESRNPRWIHH